MTPSIRARAAEPLFWFLGVRRQTKTAELAARNIDRLRRTQQAPVPPRRVQRKVEVTESRTGRWTIHTLRPRDQAPGLRIVYLHGGGYVKQMIGLHWNFGAYLAQRVPAVVDMVTYPLAYEQTAEHTIPQLAEYCATLDQSDLPVVLAGDSAGGAMALAVAQYLRDKSTSGPAGLLLICPWLDVRMRNPEQQVMQRRDCSQAIPGLRVYGAAYAGPLGMDHPYASPILGGAQGLPPTLLISAGRDMFDADDRVFADRARNEDVRLQHHRGAGMQHDYPMLAVLPEARLARRVMLDWLHEAMPVSPPPRRGRLHSVTEVEKTR
ncbi:alpha/beta hydrolase fold domain-containing protein [Nocardia brasiliensis]|uniref:alpha/beta hydrolase fold domain-containing protein n=2 Tax=Nocardia brasiliensis TaxID=37326 RepID=UPI0005A615A7|nr:alpha/beta hydrolase fold domain-containing protein [Nocardia brasiliensis]ASF12190.1 steryl acetyl hydrolase [Nocardia brasiliensis]SUB53108.1 Monoterpene epsilon-lactone hydrolase [Nocardia brasiliensis]